MFALICGVTPAEYVRNRRLTLAGSALCGTGAKVIDVALRVDSLYSIVQMPSGIPVATVAINGAKNAGILAAKMIAMSDESLLAKLKDFKEDMKDAVSAKSDKLESIGYKQYLSEM